MSRVTEEAMVDLAKLVDAVKCVHIERVGGRVEMTVTTQSAHFHVQAHTLVEAVMRAMKRSASK